MSDPSLAPKRRAASSSSQGNPEPKRPKHNPADKAVRQDLNSSRATTFGVELELTFTFHEEFLKNILSLYSPGAEIVKCFTPSHHRDLLGEYTEHAGWPYRCRFRYPSWALHVPQEDATFQARQHKGMFFSEHASDRIAVRRYVMEPLLMARQCLDNAGFHCKVIGWNEVDPDHPDDPKKAEIAYPGQPSSIMLRQSSMDYSQWTLTNDHTLIGALKTQLYAHLSQRGIDETSWSLWDSCGLELISPVYQLLGKDDAFLDIEQYLTAMETKQSSILASVWASTHIHIGFAFKTPEDISIPFLQHLAYILVLHEDLISKCFPRSRSGIKVSHDHQDGEVSTSEDQDEMVDEDFWATEPNEESGGEQQEIDEDAENETRVLTVEAEYTGENNVESNFGYLRQLILSKAKTGAEQDNAIKEAIFEEHGDVFSLISLLQRPDVPGHKDGHRFRGYIYNFANLWAFAKNQSPWKPIKPTVEFRQHECTTDIASIKHWVIFLEAVVKKAESLAVQTTSSMPLESFSSYPAQQGGKYPSENGNDRLWPYQNIHRFCSDFLELSSLEADYWQGRYDRYVDDRPTGSNLEERSE